jgi:hypothetical protein
MAKLWERATVEPRDGGRHYVFVPDEAGRTWHYIVHAPYVGQRYTRGPLVGIVTRRGQSRYLDPYGPVGTKAREIVEGYAKGAEA